MTLMGRTPDEGGIFTFVRLKGLTQNAPQADQFSIETLVLRFETRTRRNRIRHETCRRSSGRGQYMNWRGQGVGEEKGEERGDERTRYVLNVHDWAPNSGIDHGDAPVLLGIAQGFDVAAEA